MAMPVRARSGYDRGYGWAEADLPGQVVTAWAETEDGAQAKLALKLQEHFNIDSELIDWGTRSAKL